MGKRAYRPGATRTLALVGHRSSGKTSLAEVLLHATGAVRSPGRVDDGSALLTWDPAERRRGMTLQPAFAWLEWQDHLVHLVDTPGSEGMAHERTMALCAVDGAVLVVSAPDGVELGTERVLAELRARGLPTVAVATRIDRPADLDRLLRELEEASGARPVLLELPFWEDGRLAGVISLPEQRVLRYDPDGNGTFSVEPLPERVRAEARAAWERATEAVAMEHDALLEEYLEFLELPAATVLDTLARGVREGRLLPVVLSSAPRGIGGRSVLDLVVGCLPGPDARPVTGRTPVGDPVDVDPDGPFVAQLVATQLDPDGAPYHVLRVVAGEPPRTGAWRDGETGRQARIRKLYAIRGPRRAVAASVGPGALVATWEPLPGRPGSTWVADGAERVILPIPRLPVPMMASTVVPRDASTADRLPDALSLLERLDLGVRVSTHPLTGDVLVQGQGPMHLEHALERLRERTDLRFDTSLPPVDYREVPAVAVEGARGVHRRQADGGLEYGEVAIDVTPQPRQASVRLVNAASDDQVPNRFVPSIDLGIRDAMRHGPTAGYPVTGADVRLTGGEYDILFSTDAHFRLAGAEAFRAAMEQAGSTLMEPWSTTEVVAAADEVGSVLSELGTRRGRVIGVEVQGRSATVRALVPDRELRTFAPRLVAITGGRGRFTAHHSHHERVPPSLVAEAIAQSPYRSRPSSRQASTPPGGPTRADGSRPEPPDPAAVSGARPRRAANTA